MLDSMCAAAATNVPREEQVVMITGPGGETSLGQGVTRSEPKPAAPAAPEPASAAEPPPASTGAEGASAGRGTDAQTVAVPYVVACHDTWASICMRHSMLSSELLRLNGLRRQRAQTGERPHGHTRSALPHTVHPTSPSAHR